MSLPLVLVAAPLLLAVGVGVLWLVWRRPVVAAVVWSLLTATQASSVVGTFGGLSLYLLGLGLLAVAVVAALLQGQVRPRPNALWLLPVVWLLTRAVTSTTAVDQTVAWRTVGGEAKELVAFAMVLLLVRTQRHVRAVVVALVGGIAVLCALTVVQEYLLGNATDFFGFAKVPLGADVGSSTVRHAGPSEDVNFWSRAILLAFPFALSLALGEDPRHPGRPFRRSPGRWVWLLAVLAMAGGQYLTQSRGGLLAMAAGAALWLVLSGIPVRRQMLLVAVALVAALAVPGVVTRLATLGTFDRADPALADQSLVDRSAVQVVGWQMFSANPLVGVGPGDFTEAAPEFRRDSGTRLSEVIAPHNIYLEMAAEGGVVGLAGFLVLLVGVLVVAVRAWAKERLAALGALEARAGPGVVPGTRGAPGVPRGTLTAGALAGMASWAMASVFLHLSDLPLLLLAVAVVAALDSSMPTPLTDLRVPRLLRPRTVPLWSVPTAGVLVLVGVAVGLPMAGTTWTATASVTVASGVATGNSSYARDVITRPDLMETVAQAAVSDSMLEQAATAAGVTGERAAGLTASARRVPDTQTLLLSVEAGSEADARAVADALVTRNQRWTVSLETVYVVRPSGAALTVEQNQGWTAQPAIVAALGAIGLLLAARRRDDDQGAQDGPEAGGALDRDAGSEPDPEPVTAR